VTISVISVRSAGTTAAVATAEDQSGTSRSPTG
jgi:hypothetical protein